MSYKVKSLAKNWKSIFFCSQIQNFSGLMYQSCFRRLVSCFNQLINSPSFCCSPTALVQQLIAYYNS